MFLALFQEEILEILGGVFLASSDLDSWIHGQKGHEGYVSTNPSDLFKELEVHTCLELKGS